MTLAKVLARGQVTLPREVRKAADVSPGDTVMVRVTGPGTVELKVLPRLRLEEALEQYRIDQPIDIESARKQWQEQAARDAIGTAGD